MARPQTVIIAGTALMLSDFAAGLAVQRWMSAAVAKYNFIGSYLFVVGGLAFIVGCGMLAYTRSRLFNLTTGFGLAAIGSLILFNVRLDNSWTASLLIPAITLVADGLVILILGFVRSAL